MSVVSGKVKWFNANKGYGFIEPEDGSKDVFVHATELKSSNIEELDEGDKVEFVIAAGSNGKGPKAINVRVV